MAAKRKKYDDDDGRVISRMNVDGMPWYAPGAESSSSRDDNEDKPERPDYMVDDKLTRKEEFYIFFGAMRAGCLVAGIFSVLFLIIVVVCLLVW